MRMVRFSGSAGPVAQTSATKVASSAGPVANSEETADRGLWRQVFSFPNPVNEISARIVAGGVVLLAAATIVFDQPWLMIPLAYGFLARVLTGPTLSPLGQLSVRVLTPLLDATPRPVPGPPKRFAQGIGLVFSTTAAILALGFGEGGLPTSCSAYSWWRPSWSRYSRFAWDARSSQSSCGRASSPTRCVRRASTSAPGPHLVPDDRIDLVGIRPRRTAPDS